jgi:transcriptional regulator with PAS, ATPase and Fis domain
MEGPTPSLQAVQAHDVEPVICSEPMRMLMAMVERVAPGLATVLITGETGTGKELIARAIHRHSLRASKPWVDVNCAALPEHLVESELFGYEKGAFSGADAIKQGMFEMANKGTLLLDEIGELELKVQVKLLRVLDGTAYYRLGGSHKVGVDVRVIAATNQPLEQAVRSGRFRSDLYHRISQIQLRVPPLRDRVDDIAPLAQHFLRRTNPDLELSLEAIELLQSYSWPGNIRELHNVVLQAATIAQGPEIRACDLPADITAARAAITPDVEQTPPSLDEVEKQTILRALARVGGHQGAAAEQLGISRRTLIRKLKLYRIQGWEAYGAALGALGPSEQQYFRALVDIPVDVTAGNRQQTLKAVNVSVGGLAVEGVTEPFHFAKGMQLRFTLPGEVHPIESRGQIVWADAEGKAGIRFADITPELRDRLKRWLTDKQREEGWSVADPA